MARLAEVVHGVHVPHRVLPPGLGGGDDGQRKLGALVAFHALGRRLVALHRLFLAVTFGTPPDTIQLLDVPGMVEDGGGLVHVPVALEAGAVSVEGQVQVVAEHAGVVAPLSLHVTVVVEEDQGAVPIPVDGEKGNGVHPLGERPSGLQ